jgi:tripartite-type tricarboxylate transporter receptor subunit TctC
MIVPFAAGGTSDVIARVVAEEMARSLGQPIVIENVAGAGGSTALARAARAEPDGYTIAIGNAGTSAATYTIYPKLPFTPESFAPVAMVAKTFGIIALRKDFPAKDLKEFIAYAKQNPGKVNLGHAGVGSSNYLICKSFVQAAGIEVTLVGYRGAAPALTDAIGGQIDGVCDSAASVSQAIDDKLVKAVVVGSTVRLASLPDLPTSAEAGLSEFEAQGWNGLFAPKGTPPAVIAKLNGAAKAAVESETVKKRFHDLSTVAPDPNEYGSDVLGQLVTRDVEKYRKLLEEKKQRSASSRRVGKGAQATCPPSIVLHAARWWARFAQPTLRERDLPRTKKPRIARGFLLIACYRPVVPPGPFGDNVEPLGDGLIWVLPDGFIVLLRPAAALPASLLMPVPVPVVVPGVPAGAPPTEDPALVPPPAVPPALLPPACASAKVLVSAMAVANPIVASFMIAPFTCIVCGANTRAARCVPALRSRLVAVPRSFIGSRAIIESDRPRQAAQYLDASGALWVKAT